MVDVHADMDVHACLWNVFCTTEVIVYETNFKSFDPVYIGMIEGIFNKRFLQPHIFLHITLPIHCYITKLSKPIRWRIREKYNPCISATRKYSLFVEIGFNYVLFHNFMAKSEVLP